MKVLLAVSGIALLLQGSFRPPILALANKTARDGLHRTVTATTSAVRRVRPRSAVLRSLAFDASAPYTASEGTPSEAAPSSCRAMHMLAPL
jgi:hypothetical protein